MRLRVASLDWLFFLAPLHEKRGKVVFIPYNSFFSLFQTRKKLTRNYLLSKKKNHLHRSLK
ncbi:hypothetical protein NEOC95_001613 [Neochlamydia sp. AcF95]|nr:hypothetical protein [Neochlamydia sp. AcF95]